MDLDRYKLKARRLAHDESDELMFNSSPEHAAIINEVLFDNAKSSVRILCRKFDKSVYGTPDLLDAAEEFLNKGGTSIKIAIEEIDGAITGNHPFIQAFSGKENVEIKHIPEIYHEAININFTVMDDDGFRIEEDKRRPVAVATFKDEEKGRKLGTFFDKVWEYSKPYQIQGRKMSVSG